MYCGQLGYIYCTLCVFLFSWVEVHTHHHFQLFLTLTFGLFYFLEEVELA